MRKLLKTLRNIMEQENLDVSEGKHGDAYGDVDEPAGPGDRHDGTDEGKAGDKRKDKRRRQGKTPEDPNHPGIKRMPFAKESAIQEFKGDTKDHDPEILVQGIGRMLLSQARARLKRNLEGMAGLVKDERNIDHLIPTIQAYSDAISPYND